MVRRVFAAYRIFSVVVPSSCLMVRRARSSRLKKASMRATSHSCSRSSASWGEHQTVEPVPVGVGGGVFTPFSDLCCPHGRGVAKGGLGSEQFDAFAAPLAQLVLQSLLCCGP